MESTPPHAAETATTPAEATTPEPAATGVTTLLRSRRAQTFGLGALCGALALSLVVVITSIFAEAGAGRPDPVDPVPVAETGIEPPAVPEPTATPTPIATPTPTPTPTPDPEPSPTPDGGTTVPAPVPSPEPSAPAVEEEERPGNSGSAPGHTKGPKTP